MIGNDCNVTKEEKRSEKYPAGIKWTKQRKCIYDILQKAQEPLSAARIYRLSESGIDAVSTVYRILATFEEKGMVIRQTRPEDNTAVYEWNRDDHTHYAVCLECRKRIVLHDCPFAHVHLDAGTEDFTITGHRLELYGYCKDCASQGRISAQHKGR